VIVQPVLPSTPINCRCDADDDAGDVSVPVPKNANTVPAGSWRLYIGELFNLRIAEPELTPDQATTLRAWRPPRMDEADVSRNDGAHPTTSKLIDSRLL